MLTGVICHPLTVHDLNVFNPKIMINYSTQKFESQAAEFLITFSLRYTRKKGKTKKKKEVDYYKLVTTMRIFLCSKAHTSAGSIFSMRCQNAFNYLKCFIAVHLLLFDASFIFPECILNFGLILLPMINSTFDQNNIPWLYFISSTSLVISIMAQLFRWREEQMISSSTKSFNPQNLF